MRITSASEDSDMDMIEVDASKVNASGEYWSRILRTDKVNISIDFSGGVTCEDVKLT